MRANPDDAVNEDPYAFTWTYPVLALGALISMMLGSVVGVFVCALLAAIVMFIAGLVLKRHLWPLDIVSVHRSKQPKLYWTFTVMQVGAMVVAGGLIVVAGLGWLG